MSEMAENELREHIDSAASTPNSTNAGQSDLKAQKDRSCPFCGQPFTSSSLGRHLDLYIKSKNPKPPDGVHDLDEIRRIRGRITRRHARASLKGSSNKEEASRRNSSGRSSNNAPNQSANNDTRITDGSPVDSPAHTRESDGSMWLNTPTWHATGVINNLPARSSSRTNNPTPTGQAQRAQNMRSDAAGNRIERPEYTNEDTWKPQEAAEVGKAAEMALREVLGSLEAAKKRAEPRQLFDDFDFCSLSFPGLCLAVLPPPPSLFSSTPFSAAHTWSLSPPGEKQFEVVNRMVNERVALIRKAQLANLPDSVVFRHHAHLQGAYEHWFLMSESDKASAWNLEILRAVVREKDQKQQIKADLELAQQRILHLEADYDRLSRCQLPREYLLHPPNTMPVPSAVMREMGSSTLADGTEYSYDADAIINKWKSDVKSTARQRPLAQSSTHHSSTPDYVETTRNALKGDMLLNGSVFGINGPMRRDVDEQHSATEQQSVVYQTPQVPGAVIDGDDDACENGHPRLDTNANGKPEDSGSLGSYINSGALTRRNNALSNFHNPHSDLLLNGNGKRSLAPAPTDGRNKGLKLYHEQPNS
ncbi:hypothetical protein LTR37_009639 [Vermiconidia calcicola]|uniref:Uncharacterized protein n=1 Tax=Vermiconidia calcicola TaxID=1690605 RepID=A0ACC3N7J9_9PEZI|nr:hypothetical protein LTR37_009639 [Vermiconidia calcicola]